MDSIGNSPWNPCGIVHGIWIKFQWTFHGFHMESTWTGPWNPYGTHHSMDIPYGIHSGYGMEKWLGTQPKNSPCGIHGMGGFHTHSIWIPYGIYRGV
jgi:hypothetical protein